jgi:Flp pilus assembly pilin Flp
MESAMFLRFASDDSGQSAIEYALIISVVGLVAALGTMAMHDTTMTSLQAMTEPDKGEEGQLAEAVVQTLPAPSSSPVGDSFTDKLANYRKDKEKGNQGLALGHIIGHGADKKKHDDKDDEYDKKKHDDKDDEYEYGKKKHDKKKHDDKDDEYDKKKHDDEYEHEHKKEKKGDEKDEEGSDHADKKKAVALEWKPEQSGSKKKKK